MLANGLIAAHVTVEMKHNIVKAVVIIIVALVGGAVWPCIIGVLMVTYRI